MKPKNSPCEYCRLLHGVYQRARTAKEMRRAKARIKLHLRHVHSNPPSRRKIKALKMATKLAYRIYRHIKDEGVVIPLPARTSPLVKKYIAMILDANGIKWAEKNPHPEPPRHISDGLKLLLFLNKYPNRWHTIARDARTKRALKHASHILGKKLEVVVWTDKNVQINYHKS